LKKKKRATVSLDVTNFTQFSSQIHQKFMSIFCADILAQKNLQSQTVIREKLCKILLYEKGTCEMLMKLTPGDN